MNLALEKAESIARVLVKRHEGFRDEIYLDTEGFKTVGWGHNLGKAHPLPLGYEFAPSTIEKWFEQDLDRAGMLAAQFAPGLDDVVRLAVLVDMAFNLGNRLFKFTRFRAAVQKRDWPRAAREMRDSKWAVQVKSRADTLGEIMLTGELPADVKRELEV